MSIFEKMDKEVNVFFENFEEFKRNYNKHLDEYKKTLRPYDPKDPEELERFKNAPDGYPDNFLSAKEQQTSDNQTNYKRL